MIEKYFKLRERGSTPRIELMAGLTTFMTMAYIIFVNPAILSVDFNGNPTGLSLDAVLLATCLSAFLATTLMGLYANLPIAQAPGMGENFFFVTTVMGVAVAGIAESWKVALTIVLISGVLFLILSLLRFRKAIIDAISPSMKNSIAVGIGFFIAFIGLQNAGIIINNPGSYVQFNKDVLQPHVLIFIIGLLFTAILQVRRIRGAILLGILFSTFLAILFGKVQYTGIIGLPQDHAFFRFDFKNTLQIIFIPYIVVFLFMDLFDTAGTLIGVGEQAGLIQNNQLPGSNRAMVSDAVGTVFGACSGTSTVTSFIESAVGVQYGGRTGLTSIATGCFFLVALFFKPLVSMVGGGWALSGTDPIRIVNPITAPALVIVGSMMIRNINKIDWRDYSESIPAFLIILGIPLSYNIADGLAMGFVTYPIIKLCSGKGKDVNWLVYLVAVIFILRYALVTL